MKNGRIAMSILLWALFIATGNGQTLIDLRTQTKSVDFSGAGSTKPIKTGSSLPATCALGEVFFLTSAPSGSNVYGCNPANVWTAEGANLGISSGVTNKLLSNDGNSIQWIGLAGDISGLPGGLMVTGLQGRAVANTAPTDGQALVWDTASWTWKPAAVAGGITSVFGRTGTVTAQTGDYSFSQIAGTASTSQLPAGINAANIGSGTVNNTEFGYLANLTSDVQTQLSGKAPLSGDLGGTTSSAKVTGIQNRAVANTDPTDGQALVWNAATSQWKPANVSGGGAGASMASQLGDLAPVRTSATVLTIGANCSSATPCNFRFGTQTFGITASATATIGGSGTGTAYIYATGSGALVVGHNLTVACSAGCTQQPNVTSFPVDAIPLYTWTATAGTWDANGGHDQRAFLSSKTLLGGTGIEVTETAGQTTVAVDTAAVELQANRGAANGYAPLDSGSKVPVANLPSASGDVSGALNSTTVAKLQGRAVANTAPTDGQALVWNNADSTWQPGTVSGSGTPFNVFSPNLVLWDDFIPVTTSNAFGALSWTVGNIGSAGSVNNLATPNANHPGIIRIATTSTSGNGEFLAVPTTNGQTVYTLGTGGPSGGWETQAIVRLPNIYGNLATSRFIVGFQDSLTAYHGAGGNEIAVRFDPVGGGCGAGESTTNWVYEVIVAGTQSCVDSGVTVAANTWYRLRMYSTSLGTVKFQIGVNGGALGSDGTIDTAPTASLYPILLAITGTTSATQLEVDWWAMQMTGLAR